MSNTGLANKPIGLGSANPKAILAPSTKGFSTIASILSSILSLKSSTLVGSPVKSKNESRAGLGLGIFIGKTLLEKNKAKLLIRNSETRGGAEIKIEWSNKDLISF